MVIVTAEILYNALYPQARVDKMPDKLYFAKAAERLTKLLNPSIVDEQTDDSSLPTILSEG